LSVVADQRELVSSNKRLSTGLPELDEVIEGGIPEKSLVLVAGNPGSGKTTFCVHFIAEGLANQESVVYLSLGESEQEFRANYGKMGFEFPLDSEKFHFIESLTTSQNGVSDILKDLLAVIDKIHPSRLVIDSFSALSQSVSEPFELRQIIHTIFDKVVKNMGCTTFFIIEMPLGGTRLGTGIEEFVADAIIILEREFDKDTGRSSRRIRVQKMRGTAVKEARIAYNIESGGITIFRGESPNYPDKTSHRRASTGVVGLDKMLSGGFFGGSMNLVTGATGSGKTVLVSQFTNEGLKEGERCLFITYEDVPLDLRRNAQALGMKYFCQTVGSKGNLNIVSFNPDLLGIEEHVQKVVRLIREIKPNRVVIDSLSALQPALDNAELDTFIRSLRVVSKELDVVTVCTSIVSFLGATSTSDAKISSYFDSIIMLRHVEIDSQMHRSILVLKIRGSAHDKDIREADIVPGSGLVVSQKFKGVENILLGSGRKAYTLEDLRTREKSLVLSGRKFLSDQRRRNHREERLLKKRHREEERSALNRIIVEKRRREKQIEELIRKAKKKKTA
jgi:circadian clock protein KaiC